jgi:hypothetical protein
LHEDMKKISIAYKDLKKFLPEDYETKRWNFIILVVTLPTTIV